MFFLPFPRIFSNKNFLFLKSQIQCYIGEIKLQYSTGVCFTYPTLLLWFNQSVLIFIQFFPLDPDVTMTSSDGVFVISKAVELFVESLAIESYTYTANSKKKTISRQDVEKAIDAVDALAFLDGAMDD